PTAPTMKARKQRRSRRCSLRHRRDGDDDRRAVGGKVTRSAEHRRFPEMEGPRCLPAGVRPGPARPEGSARGNLHSSTYVARRVSELY
ncbi:MAG: hypothetical protein ACXW06_08040, partial [Halobacteriota archaeon]